MLQRLVLATMFLFFLRWQALQEFEETGPADRNLSSPVEVSGGPGLGVPGITCEGIRRMMKMQ